MLILVLLSKTGVETVLYESLVLADVAADWWSLVTLLEDCSASLVGDEDRRLMIDHLFFNAFD